MAILANLSNLESVPPESPLYLQFRGGNRYKEVVDINGVVIVHHSAPKLCEAVCSEPPYYRCTRAKNHERFRHKDGSYADHIAHGVEGKMFARWNDEEREEKE